MEKDYRLFVKNLPLNIDDDGLRKIFGKLVTIKKIDLKEKKDLDNKINKFAFVNVTTTDKALQQCFGELNGGRFDGFEISVELAKESFLDRLKREREENKSNNKPAIDYSKSTTFKNIVNIESKHKTFDNEDFSSKEFEVENVKRKRKTCTDYTSDFKVHPVQSFEDVECKTIEFEKPCQSLKTEKETYLNNLDTADIEMKQRITDADNFKVRPMQSFEDVEYKTNDFKNSDNSFNTVKTNYLNNVGTVDTEISNIRKKKRAKISIEYNKDKSKKPIVPEKPISKSEIKRLTSLKEKKKLFKAQEKVIRNALKSVDDTKLNKKIVFDDDIDIQNLNEIDKKNSKHKNTLFESDNEEQEEFGWNEEELDAKANIKRKLLKMQTNIGNDKRFVLDERFVDDEEIVKESNITEPNDDANFDEKKWQLGILEKVLGKPITTLAATNDDTIQKKKMIRYDPTANDHEKYEVTVEKPKEEKSKKKKKKKIIEEVQEEAPLPTSKEIYYDVSEKLADSFKPNEGFSLLKTLGCVEVAGKCETEPIKETEEKESGFKFSFSSKNPFKYDSSDDEGENEKGGNDYNFELNANNMTADDDRLFTPLGDSRIEELNNFFNAPTTVDEEAFKRRRRELKKIVRTKIRNNLKKATPWNKKKVWKQSKKHRQK